MSLSSIDAQSQASNPALIPEIEISPLIPIGSISQAVTSPGNEAAGEEESAESGGLRPDRILQLLARKYQIIVICLMLMVGFNCLKTIQAKPMFKGSFRLLVEPIQKNNQLKKITEGDNTSSEEFDYSSQIEVLLSPRVLTPAANKLKSQFPDMDYSMMVGRLSIIRLGKTKIIEINYSSGNPIEVKKVLQTVSSAYLGYSLNEQREQSRRGLRFIGQQLPQAQAQSDKLQQELQVLRQKYGFIDPEIYAKEVREQIGQAAEQLQTIQSSLIALEARYRSLEGIARSAVLDQSSAYQGYQSQYQVLERQIAVETARYGENHPTIQLYRRQQENLRPLLQREAKRVLSNQLAAVASDIQVTMAQRDSLRAIEKQLSSRLKQMPVVSRRYNELLRKISVVNDSLKRLLETRETLEIAASQSEVPWQLITQIQDPETLLGMTLSKAILMGTLSGIVLGTVLAYTAEKIENTFHTVADLQEAIHLPIFGIIPFRPNLKRTGPVLHHVDFWQQKRITELTGGLRHRQELNPGLLIDLPTLESGIPVINPEMLIGDWGMFWNAERAYTFLESFRTLQINLSQRGDCNSITVSSATSGEGKTTVATLLALAAAVMGKKVLLIDAHLHQGEGAVHEFLSMTQSPGLSDYLLELQPLEDCIRAVIWEDNFWVMTIGSVTTDPSRFLSSLRMKELMKTVATQFDWVIYNVPSFGALADARLIAQQTQSLLLVMQLGCWGSRSRFTQLQQDLATASIPLTGLVVNGAREKNIKSYQRERDNVKTRIKEQDEDDDDDS